MELHPHQLDELGLEHVELHFGGHLDLDGAGRADHGDLHQAAVTAVRLDQVEEAALFTVVVAFGVGEDLAHEVLFVMVGASEEAGHAGRICRAPFVGAQVPPEWNRMAARLRGVASAIATARAAASGTGGVEGGASTFSSATIGAGARNELVAAVVASAAQEEHAEGDEEGEDDGDELIDADERLARGLAEVHVGLRSREGSWGPQQVLRPVKFAQIILGQRSCCVEKIWL